jgi:hypothetical protein
LGCIIKPALNEGHRDIAREEAEGKRVRERERERERSDNED